MIIRLSQKLAKKIKVTRLVEEPLDKNQYADWSANVFNVERTQYIILCNTKSMYSCVMYASGITSDSTFIKRALSLIREFMEDDEKLSVYEQNIIPASGSVTFAKSLNRSVIGSMNELVLAATYALQSEEVAPHSVGTFLNGTLLSAIAADGDRRYGTPREAFERLTSGKTS